MIERFSSSNKPKVGTVVLILPYYELTKQIVRDLENYNLNYNIGVVVDEHPPILPSGYSKRRKHITPVKVNNTTELIPTVFLTKVNYKTLMKGQKDD